MLIKIFKKIANIELNEDNFIYDFFYNKWSQNVFCDGMAISLVANGKNLIIGFNINENNYVVFDENLCRNFQRKQQWHLQKQRFLSAPCLAKYINDLHKNYEKQLKRQKHLKKKYSEARQDIKTGKWYDGFGKELKT